jgi:HD-like signal output (HDOD) protein
LNCWFPRERPSTADAPACHGVESAVAAVGPDAVRALVLDIASRNFFAPIPSSRFDALHRIWRNSLIAADLAQVLATLTRYRNPEQARLCGLLLGVAPMQLAGRGRPEYLALVGSEVEPADLLDAQRRQFETDQVEHGIGLAETWCPDSFAVDAMRYQFAPAEQVGDAHHLVKIVNLASRLAMQAGPLDAAIEAAEILFGLEAELTRTLHQRVTRDVDRLATAIGMPANDAEPSEACTSGAYRELGQRLDLNTRVLQTRGELREAADATALRSAVRAGARRLLRVERSLLFLADAQAEHLYAWLDGDEEPTFVLALTSGRSLVAETLLAGSPQRGEGTAVVDRQLAGLLRTEQLWCLPLVQDEARLGVLVLGLPTEDDGGPGEPGAAADALASEVAAALSARAGGAGTVDSAARDQLRFAASTPLTVIHNHLEMLRTRIGDDAIACEDLERIRGETLRIERILGGAEKMTVPPVVHDIALNELVEEVAASLEASLFAPAGIRLMLDLDARGPRLPGPAGEVQPLLRLLLRHAGETLRAGSDVVVSTRGRVSVNGREHVELEVRDNGPGLPDEVVARWEGSESGGSDTAQADSVLDRVREFTEAMGATMICTSNRDGTRFQLLLPGRLPADTSVSARGVA